MRFLYTSLQNSILISFTHYSDSNQRNILSQLVCFLEKVSLMTIVITYESIEEWRDSGKCMASGLCLVLVLRAVPHVGEWSKCVVYDCGRCGATLATQQHWGFPRHTINHSLTHSLTHSLPHSSCFHLTQLHLSYFLLFTPHIHTFSYITAHITGE
jgi:hypothetical protein